MPPRTQAIALGALLVLAGLLRFTGLSWGLRHVPDPDERCFVENVGWMLAEGDLDHRFYQYPGLFFYLITPAVAPFDPLSVSPPAYLAARAVVASFGVLSVLLVFILGSRVGGAAVGLTAGLLLAVSPVEVFTAHAVRPDVVLESLVLAAFLVFARVGARAREDVLSGVAVGVATAVKFSGILLVPSYVTTRLLTAGFRWTRLLQAGLASAVAFALCSPYSLLDLSGAVAGARTQVAYHYVESPRGEEGYWGTAWTYFLILWKAMGPAALPLIAAGVVLSRVEWRRWLPLAMFPLVTVAVFSTAQVHHNRFLLPALGVIALFAGRAVSALATRSRSLAVVIALAAAAPPLADSVSYVAGISRPSTKDLALDWVDANLPAGTRFLTAIPDLGIDRTRYEVVSPERLDDDERLRQLALHVDAVVTAHDFGKVLGDFRILHAVEPPNPHAGLRVTIRAAPPELRPTYDDVPIEASWITVSASGDRVAALVDRDPATAWNIQGGEAWVQVQFPQTRTLAQVELLAPGRGRLFPKTVRLLVKESGGVWRRVAPMDLRPPVEEQSTGKGRTSRVLLLEPILAKGLRIDLVGPRNRAWGIAEIRVRSPRVAAGP